MVQNFEIQFLQEATKFVPDFKSLAKETNESLDKQKSLELEIEWLLKASVSHDIMSIEKEYAVLWNNWYTKCEESKYDKISYDKAYNDMQQKVERLQAQLRDLKGKSSDTPSASNTIDPLNQKLEIKIVELEFQVVDKPKLIVVTPYSKKLHASIPSHSVPQPREFNAMKHYNVIAPGMFKINPSQTSRVDLVPNNQSSTSSRTNPITNFQCHVTFKENVSSETVNASFIGILFLSKNQKTMSSECNNIKLAIRNDKSKIVYGTCKQCLVTANHDTCLLSSVNALNSHANNLCANVPLSANQKRHRIQVWKPKQVEFKERLAYTPKPRLPRFSLKWSPSKRSFDLKGKLVASKETSCPNDDKACPSNPQEPIRKRFPNSTVFLGRLSKFICGASTRVVPSISPGTSSFSSTLCVSFWELFALGTTTLLQFWDMVILYREILQSSGFTLLKV
nr:hypothetical protein [Tanacetum cinerariifolium]